MSLSSPQSDPQWEPRKIALCITGLEAGGAEQALAELAIRLDRSRFLPTVYCLAPRPKDEARSLVPALEAAGIPLHFLGARRTSQFPLVVQRLASLLRDSHPALVQTFLFHANIVGCLAARLAGVGPVVAGIRVAERRPGVRLWIERRTAGLVARHVCVSQGVAEFSRRQGGLPPEKLVVIPNGIDLSRYDRPLPADLTQYGLPPGRKAVVYVGRLAPQKRVDWLLEHAAVWLATSPAHDLLIVGDGPQGSSLAALARQKGIQDRVHFVGWRANVPAILAASDLLVLPSAWEGMPNVVLEAMASSLPVVATRVEGVEELLGPRADSQSAPANDPSAFCERIQSMLCNNKLQKELGDANRLRAERHFSLAAMVSAYARLYESLIEP